MGTITPRFANPSGPTTALLTRMTVQLFEFISHVIVADFVSEIVERLGFGHVAHGPPFRIAGNAVISAALYIHRRQVQ